MRAASASSRSRPRRGSPPSCPGHRCCMPGSACCVAGSRESGEALDAAIEEARAMGNAHSIAGLLVNRSLTALARRGARRRRDGREGERRADPERGRRFRRSRVRGRARRVAPRGGRPRPPGGGEPAARAGGRTGAPAAAPSRLPGQVAGAADALLARARPPGRRPTCGALRRRRRADGCGLLLARAMADRAAAAIALRSGDASGAARLALASAVACDDAGIPIEAGRSRTLAGRALSRAGQSRHAVVGARARGVGPPRVRRRQVPQRSRPGAATARPARPPPHATRASRPRSAWPP